MKFFKELQSVKWALAITKVYKDIVKLKTDKVHFSRVEKYSIFYYSISFLLFFLLFKTWIGARIILLYLVA